MHRPKTLGELGDVELTSVDAKIEVVFCVYYRKDKQFELGGD